MSALFNLDDMPYAIGHVSFTPQQKEAAKKRQASAHANFRNRERILAKLSPAEYERFINEEQARIETEVADILASKGRH